MTQVRGKKGDGERWASMPYQTRVEGASKEGMIRRQCTKEYKIQPIEKKLRELIGYLPRQVILTGVVAQWYGIPHDEMRHARLSDKRWIVNHYPLIFDIPSTRQSCEVWLKAHGAQIGLHWLSFPF